jgi:hypothetical protein
LLGIFFIKFDLGYRRAEAERFAPRRRGLSNPLYFSPITVASRSGHAALVADLAPRRPTIAADHLIDFWRDDP